MEYSLFRAPPSALYSALLPYLQPTMVTPPRLDYSPNPQLGEAELRSDHVLDPKLSLRSQRSKLEMCRSRLGMQKTAVSELIGQGMGDAAARSTAEVSAQTTSSQREGERINSSLRQALARRLVKDQIFACMDKGDNKTEIESTTGLSHQCIKWYRRLWRTEGSHPRPPSRRVSKSSTRGPQSSTTPSERLLKEQPECDAKGDPADAGESSTSKRRQRRRKRRTVKQSKGRSVCMGMKTPGSGGKEYVEREVRGSDYLGDKENVPEWMSR